MQAAFDREDAEFVATYEELASADSNEALLLADEAEARKLMLADREAHKDERMTMFRGWGGRHAREWMADRWASPPRRYRPRVTPRRSYRHARGRAPRPVRVRATSSHGPPRPRSSRDDDDLAELGAAA